MAGRVDVSRVVVGSLAATQNDMAVFIAGCGDNRRVAGLGDGKKMMWRLRGADGVDGDADIAIGAVLEADRAGKSGGEFSVHLRFG